MRRWWVGHVGWRGVMYITECPSNEAEGAKKYEQLIMPPAAETLRQVKAEKKDLTRKILQLQLAEVLARSMA